jgi:hypothetical protein
MCSFTFWVRATNAKESSTYTVISTLRRENAASSRHTMAWSTQLTSATDQTYEVFQLRQPIAISLHPNGLLRERRRLLIPGYSYTMCSSYAHFPGATSNLSFANPYWELGPYRLSSSYNGFVSLQYLTSAPPSITLTNFPLSIGPGCKDTLSSVGSA